MHKWLTGEWFIERTSARRRRVIHYWATILWLTVGLVFWIILRDALWFVGFMSLYAIWVTHLAGWAAETPVEAETADAQVGAAEAVGAPALVEPDAS
jgi:signal transduction histidine kinase